MNAHTNMQHLITKNWFYTILMGSIILAAWMTGVQVFHPAYDVNISPLWMIPTSISVLVSSIVLSLPAFLLAQKAFEGLKLLNLTPTLARYCVVLLLLILVWGTGALLFPAIFNADVTNPNVFAALCAYSFSASYFFTSDETLLDHISDGRGVV